MNAHHVPAFKLAYKAERSPGAHQFAFDETRAMRCVTAKRRLVASNYTGCLSVLKSSHVLTLILILPASSFVPGGRSTTHGFASHIFVCTGQLNARGCYKQLYLSQFSIV